MKKNYVSPEFDLYEMKLLNSIMIGDSRPETPGDDENDPDNDNNPFG